MAIATVRLFTCDANHASTNNVLSVDLATNLLCISQYDAGDSNQLWDVNPTSVILQRYTITHNATQAAVAVNSINEKLQLFPNNAPAPPNILPAEFFIEGFQFMQAFKIASATDKSKLIYYRDPNYITLGLPAQPLPQEPSYVEWLAHIRPLATEDCGAE